MASTAKVATSRAMVDKYLALSTPPGPASFWFGLGAMVRSVGKVVDEAGRMLQADTGHEEKRASPSLARAARRAPLARARWREEE
jgi:hypothetical protein